MTSRSPVLLNKQVKWFTDFYGFFLIMFLTKEITYKKLYST